MLRHLPDNPDTPGIHEIPDSKATEDVSFFIHMVNFLYNAAPPPQIPNSDFRYTVMVNRMASLAQVESIDPDAPSELGVPMIFFIFDLNG